MKQLVDGRWFYVLVGVLNVAIGVMFYTVNLQPQQPQLVTIEPIIHRPQPSRLHIIPAITGTPTRILVPSLKIDLAVGVGSFDVTSNSWTIDASRAFYADISLPANNSNGRTLIYGHAQWQVFGNLPDIGPQAEAIVETDSGYEFHYSYQSKTDVAPTDTTIFSASGPPTLILQTCSGNWDAYRTMYSFKFETVTKI